MKDYHERILLGVGSKFGKNSIEYEKAGGTKKFAREKPAKSSGANADKNSQ